MRITHLLLLSIWVITLTACGKFETSNKGNENSLSKPMLKLGALGDSITRGYDISQLFKEDVDKSWSTGIATSESILNQLLRIISPEVYGGISVRNFAVTGQSVMGSNSLFQEEAQQLASFSPHIVTIEIGANDVCQGLVDTPEKVAAFQQKVSTAISTLMNAPIKPTLISLATVPNILGLTQIPQLSSNLVCQNAWALACPNLSVGAATFQAQWSAVNQALEAAATAAGSTVVFDNGAVANTVFTVNDVSALDCFHPSAVGQGKLGTVVWSTISNKLNQILSAN